MYNSENATTERKCYKNITKSFKQKKIPRLEFKVRNLLQLVFNEYRYPTLELKKRISSETGLKMELVNMWMSKR